MGRRVECLVPCLVHTILTEWLPRCSLRGLLHLNGNCQLLPRGHPTIAQTYPNLLAGVLRLNPESSRVDKTLIMATRTILLATPTLTRNMILGEIASGRVYVRTFLYIAGRKRSSLSPALGVFLRV